MEIKDIQKELEVINKKYDYEYVMFNAENLKKVDVISTGSLGLDFKTGIGGIPIGRVTEIFGQNSSGKSTMCGHIIANAHKMDKLAALIDAEHDCDLSYYASLGVDLKKLVFYQPDDMEQALSLLEDLISLDKFGVVVFDSIAALGTKAELEGEMEDKQVGDKARLMSKAMRKISPILSKSTTALVFTNQIRENISKFGYGESSTTPGGLAVKFKASLRIKLSTIQSEVKGGDDSIGTRIRAKVMKNKLGRPFSEWEFTIVWGKGIVFEYDLLELAVQMEIVTKKGPWFAYTGTNFSQGLLNGVRVLQENQELRMKIETDVRETLGM